MKLWKIFGIGIVTTMAAGNNIGDGEEGEEGSFDEHDSRGLDRRWLDSNFSYSDWITLGPSGPKRIRISRVSDGSSSENQSQDADYVRVSSLSDEVENRIFARFPRSELWKIGFINRRCLALSRSGEIYRIRKEIGVRSPSVLMYASGQSTWWEFDRDFKSCRRLPFFPSDPSFLNGDKESLCAGTHMLVSGNEMGELVVWRYELPENKWCKGPSMITPRCLFASASCGSVAYVAGGMGAGLNAEVFDSAERYDPERGSWEPLPKMRRRRRLCAGCYMDGRFYVIGGRNGDGELTCGEFLDESTGGKNGWELIPGMLRDDPVRSSHSPPLVAVVGNELYALEASTNQLKVYLKATNTWKRLGPVPVRADCHKGWGVAFKSLGDELLVIGSSAAGNRVAIYTCRPGAGELTWRALDSGRNCLSFILNCCVMVA